MKKHFLYLIGFLLLITCCTFNFTTNGSLMIDITKDSLDIMYNEVQMIVNNMDHMKIKDNLSNQFPDFDKKSIENSYINYTKMWDLDKKVKKANIFIRVTLSCSPTKSDESKKLIQFYEDLIVKELANHNIVAKSN